MPHAMSSLRIFAFASATVLSLIACGGRAASQTADQTSPTDVTPGDGRPTPDPQPVPAPYPDTTPQCSSQCCFTPRPAAGAPCTAEADAQSCPDVTWCPSGLVLDDRKLTCVSGVWTATGGSCPAPGQTNELGCPGTQPTNGSACGASEGTQCHYFVDCVVGAPCPDAGPPPPDGSKRTGCVQAHHVDSEDATCTGGAWTTKALPACL
jgi:hypothetical protein